MVTMLKKIQSRNGQAMLVMVMVLGITMLGVSAIAGYITIQQLRTAGDVSNSAQAIYAADAGTDWALFQLYLCPAQPTSSLCTNAQEFQQTLENGATVDARMTATSVQSIGSAGRANRAFGFYLATSTP